MTSAQLSGSLRLAAWIRNPTGSRQVAAAQLRIDTGAELAIVDPRILAALAVRPVGTQTLQGVTGATRSAPLYRVDLDLGPGGRLTQVLVAGIPLPAAAGADGLFGDNLLRRGILVYNGPANTWTFQVVQ